MQHLVFEKFNIFTQDLAVRDIVRGSVEFTVRRIAIVKQN